tara:strand:+ start:6836 stop:7762 length:927 start_codon:yes stop_codon:yes gene_type:complete
MSLKAIESTDFKFPNQIDVYNGKVRDVYFFKNKIAVIATDRISAFDHVLPAAIPYKGQVLNKIAAYFLDATKDIVPNWVQGIPHANVTVGMNCEPIRLEMVIRGYLTGHAWRTYKAGGRELCGISFAEGMKENQKFDKAIITPAAKAMEGHDIDISKEDLLKQGLVTEEIWNVLADYTEKLFAKGTEMAAEKGLILVDTKYEFGIFDGEVVLIDEIHTPDSSRYFYADSFQENFDAGTTPKHLSKEFVREWLMENGFQGLEGQQMPAMTNEVVNMITDRYVELYEKITGQSFEKQSIDNIEEKVIEAL